MSEFLFDHHAQMAENHLASIKADIEKAAKDYQAALESIDKKHAKFLSSLGKMSVAGANVLRQREKKLVKELEKANAKIRDLESMMPHATADAAAQALEKSAIEKACSLAVFDSLLFAMEEWAVDDAPASDFRLVSQSLIFKIVYEPIMRGESDYYIEKVPVAALEIVRRGREYISSIRQQYAAAMTDPDVWDQVIPMVHEWWINDALPLLYGARDDTWADAVPYTLDEMLAWRDQPASRALDFPLIWDGTELIGKYGDEIRENTGIGEFQNKHMQTRLTAHE